MPSCNVVCICRSLSPLLPSLLPAGLLPSLHLSLHPSLPLSVPLSVGSLSPSLLPSLSTSQAPYVPLPFYDARTLSPFLLPSLPPLSPSIQHIQTYPPNTFLFTFLTHLFLIFSPLSPNESQFLPPSPPQSLNPLSISTSRSVSPSFSSSLLSVFRPLLLPSIHCSIFPFFIRPVFQLFFGCFV